MSLIQAGLHITRARADEAYRRLSRHCLGCTACRAKEECPESTALLLTWGRAHRAARG